MTGHRTKKFTFGLYCNYCRQVLCSGLNAFDLQTGWAIPALLYFHFYNVFGYTFFTTECVVDPFQENLPKLVKCKEVLTTQEYRDLVQLWTQDLERAPQAIDHVRLEYTLRLCAVLRGMTNRFWTQRFVNCTNQHNDILCSLQTSIDDAFVNDKNRTWNIKQYLPNEVEGSITVDDKKRKLRSKSGRKYGYLKEQMEETVDVITGKIKSTPTSLGAVTRSAKGSQEKFQRFITASSLIPPPSGGKVN